MCVCVCARVYVSVDRINDRENAWRDRDCEDMYIQSCAISIRQSRILFFFPIENF